MTTRQFVQQGGTESRVLAPSLSGGDVYDDVDDDDDALQLALDSARFEFTLKMRLNRI